MAHGPEDGVFVFAPIRLPYLPGHRLPVFSEVGPQRTKTKFKIKEEYFMERFKKIYQQGTIDVVEIWVDTETGVNYVFHRNGNAAGFTALLDKEGKPIITP